MHLVFWNSLDDPADPSKRSPTSTCTWGQDDMSFTDSLKLVNNPLPPTTTKICHDIMNWVGP